MKKCFSQKKILKLIYSFLIISFLSCSFCFAIESKHGLDGFKINVIDAAKNAKDHSNMGNIYFEEGKYIAALKEYEIAYNLMPNSQMAGVYLYNISKCYIAINNYKLAKFAIEGAIKKDCINMTYYDLLAQCVVKLGIEKQEIEKYKKDVENPYNRIIIGLIYLKIGKKIQSKTIFDDFVCQNPDMIITQDVKVLLNSL